MQASHAPDAWRARWRASLAPRSGHQVDASGALFAFLLFTLSQAWMLYARELPGSPWALVSSSLQAALFWTACLFIEDRLVSGGWRVLWAALGTFATALLLLDGLLLRMTSLPIREILPMLLASQHVVEGMREIGLGPLRLAVLLCALCFAAAGGGLVRVALAVLFTQRRRARAGARAWAGLVLAALAFCGEQVLARDHEDYLYRAVRMPLYAQLFNTSRSSVEIPLPPPVEHATRATWRARIGPARAPRHVLYVLLESFRADAVEPRVCPNIWQLAEHSLYCTNALAEATYTPLSWSVLMFDESAGDNLFGRHSGRPQPLGGWLFTVMEKAGLDAHVFVSTNLTYAKTRERLLGRDAALDFFQAAADTGDDPSDKNRNDRVAVDHTVEFIRQHDWSSGGPQFLLLQLDSTHYTYPFPEDQALFTPYSENLVLPRPIETSSEAELLHNRYRNAAHFVDAQLGRVLAALRAAGIYDDMLIVLTADHGEGLLPGLQGHAAVADVTKRVPLLFRMPGLAASRYDALVSHRDILPTLAHWLAIDMPSDITRGRPLSEGGAPGVLTLAPSGRFGQFTTPDYVVDLRMVFKAESVTVTPAQIRAAHLHAPAPTHVETARWLPQLVEFLQNTRLAH